MKIFEAYDKSAVRLHFKEYIEAEGISMSKRELIYTRFGTYISRIRGVRFDKFLLEAKDENDFKARLNTIFFDKWKNHLGYPEIPAYFFRYLDFLHRQRALYDDFEIDGLGEDSDCRIESGEFTRYEERFLTADGKLRILANPELIRMLKDAHLLKSPVTETAVKICKTFYESCRLNMTSEDWTKIIGEVSKPEKKKGKRGDISYELKYADGETKICNSYQAMERIVSMAGIEKVAQCNLRLNGKPIVVKWIPKEKENNLTFRMSDDGYYLNNMGKSIDRFKVMRILISMYRLPVEINLSKEKAIKSRPSRKKTGKPSDKNSIPPESNDVSEVTNVGGITDVEPLDPIVMTDVSGIDSDFIFGENGILNLFDDF